VHRTGCATFRRLAAAQPGRILPVEWGAVTGGNGQEVDLQLDAIDRKWLLKDVTNLIAQEDAHVVDIRSEPARGGFLRLRLRVRVADYGHLSRLLGKLDASVGVEQVRRV
jgi:GTP pyrophosphokinase